MNKENSALKLVDEIILYYDARSKKHQKTAYVINLVNTYRTFRVFCYVYEDSTIFWVETAAYVSTVEVPS